MDQFSKKQAQISQHREEASARYPMLWSKMIAEWIQPGSDDRAWLMYSANYLFRTNNIRWAMDPLRLIHRLPQAPDVNIAQDLKALSFVLLTHEHADHLDLGLIDKLRHLPILWVIPEPTLALIQNQIDLPRRYVTVPRDLEPIEFQGIKITPFDGLHWENQEYQVNENASSLQGVPATGYLVEFQNKRWLFPGDTRTYDVGQLPSFGPIDGLFAHLWLGRGCALMDEPPMLDTFCRFYRDLQPSRIILTHLNEFGRDADDFWDEAYAEKLCSKIRGFPGGISANPALMGNSVLL
jgi:L-ascorbate metabolism protein UlaG (beta-lactamase superfamily)